MRIPILSLFPVYSSFSLRCFPMHLSFSFVVSLLHSLDKPKNFMVSSLPHFLYSSLVSTGHVPSKLRVAGSIPAGRAKLCIP